MWKYKMLNFLKILNAIPTTEPTVLIKYIFHTEFKYGNDHLNYLQF